jgi:hypothetical protein
MFICSERLGNSVRDSDMHRSAVYKVELIGASCIHFT